MNQALSVILELRGLIHCKFWVPQPNAGAQGIANAENCMGELFTDWLIKECCDSLMRYKEF